MDGHGEGGPDRGLPRGVAAQSVHAVQGATQLGLKKLLALEDARFGAEQDAGRALNLLDLAVYFGFVDEALEDAFGSGVLGAREAL